jgi:hypothetical protein
MGWEHGKDMDSNTLLLSKQNIIYNICGGRTKEIEKNRGA